MTDKDEAEQLAAGWTLEQSPDPQRYDPAARQWRNAYEDQIVGPNSETRAQMRVKLLGQLDELDRQIGQRHGDELEGIKLRLRIHRERCGLLGIPAGIGEPW